MSAPLSDEQLAAFARDGFLVLPNFYERAEVEAVQRGVHLIIGLLIEQHQLAIEQTDFAPETFDAGYQALIAHDRALGGVVYDAAKQIPAFIRLVASAQHEAVVRQVRGTDAPAIAAGGYGIRIDNPCEEKFRAGWLYFLVPNMFANTADFVVADHVNHFSESSLRRLLDEGGFAVREIDATAHNSAWVVLAEKRESLELIVRTGPVADEVRAVAEYWLGFGGRVRAFESGARGEAAIYGTFIHSCLGDPDRVQCLLDQNPHRHQQPLLGKRICEPEALPGSVSALYIGLNPRVARDEMAAEDCLKARDLRLFFA